MARFSSPLNRVRIAAPCKADWDGMIGNDRVRFCGQCNLNVYNLSSMARHEAESFVTRNEGRMCVRFYRRADGSILTRNCPIGLRAIRQRLSGLARATTTLVLGFFAGLGIYETVATKGREAEGRMGVMALPIEKQLPSEVGDVVMTGTFLAPSAGDK